MYRKITKKKITSSCKEFVEFLFTSHMKLEEGDDIEVERAHRTPANPTSLQYKDKQRRPRPIHCKLLRHVDRQFVLGQAAKTLKNNPLKKNSIFIRDDVSKKVRILRKILKEKHLERVRQKPDVKFAFIPFSVPPVIKYKTHDGQFKTYVLNK